MAVTKIWSVKGNLKGVVDYAMNPDKTLNDYYTNTELQSLKDVIDYAVESEKTEMQYFVSGINCNPGFARDQMTETKKLFHKQDGIIAFHGYQSFKPGEVTPELAHKIGNELAQKLWGDRHEVVVATHLDRGHIHNHFVVNSVSMVDGKKFNACKQSYALMRKVSDELCLAHGLSIVEKPQKAPRRMTYLAEKNGENHQYDLLKFHIDDCLSRSSNIRTFIWQMEKKGYTFDFNRPEPTVYHKRFNRPVWLCDLGDGYAINDIEEVILTKRHYTRRVTHNSITFKTLFFDGDPYNYKSGISSSYTCLCKGLLMFKEHPHCNEVENYLEQELLKFDQLCEEQNLLLDNNVESYEELEALISNTEKELQEMDKARNVFRNKLKCAVRSGDENLQKEIREDIATLTAAMRVARKNIKILNRVKYRAEDVVNRMDSINEHSRMYERYARDDYKTKTTTNKTQERNYER